MNPNQKKPYDKPQNTKVGGKHNNSSGSSNNSSKGVSRGAAIRAHKRTQDDAHKALSQYVTMANQQRTTDNQPRANKIISYSDRLKITFLGGQEAIGEKNMQVLEWQNDAVILDCGNFLGTELPGVTYAIADTT